MSHRFDSLLLRGVFGVALGVAAIAGAVGQAVDFRGELVLHEVRVQRVPAPEPVLECAMQAPAIEVVATRSMPSNG